jgi:uncharacterized protein YyaL (SSP411 family)
MARRLVFCLSVALAFAASGTTRYVTDRRDAPVQWLEWGPAALQAAQQQNRPIFLSIGFASSWDCERMHLEAFRDASNAAILNAEYVPVLLDRIEYPEVARTYEALGRGAGGSETWPLNVFLTPSLEPFAAIGFADSGELRSALEHNAGRWAAGAGAVTAEAHANVLRVRANVEPVRPGETDLAMLDAVVEQLTADFAKTKRLSPSAILFLLRYADRAKHEPTRALTVSALKQLAVSPMRDQLGGGFHRCETCFEKLLTDQALLGTAYLEAWQLTRDPDFAHVARTTLDYVVRDLRLPGSLFDASQDAQSLVPLDGRPVLRNGAFYVWTRDEVVRVVGNEAAGKIASVYGLAERGENRLALREARFFGETYDELAAPLAKLLEFRQKRPAPFRELPMTASNALMISALARGAMAFDERRYAEAAVEVAGILATKAWNASKKTLLRTSSGTPALAEDYAFAVQGMLDVFELTSDPKWLDTAVALQRRQDALFWDASAGRYATGLTVPEIVRGTAAPSERETPDANSVAAVNLARLAVLTGDPAWGERPGMIFQSHGTAIRRRGADLAAMAAAFETTQRPASIEVVVGEPRVKESHELLRPIRERWQPMRFVLTLYPKGAARERLTKALPFLAALTPDPENPKLPVHYVCANGECVRR